LVVIAARRAYKDAVRWTVAERGRIPTPVIARRLLAALFCSGMVVLGLIGLSSPSTFESPRSGWQWWALLAAVILAAAELAIRWRRWLAPILHKTSSHDAVEAAASALESCPVAYRTRYSMGWVWGPAGAGVLAAIFAFSSAYFIVDAILARGNIGPEQALLCVAQLIIALVILWLAATRLTTMRFAREAVQLANR
jgi:hypothetical protein